MILNTYNDFNFLFRQTGYYIYAEDKSLWGTGTLPERVNVGLAMVWTFDPPEEPNPSYYYTAREDDLKILGEVGIEAHIRMYAANKWRTGDTSVQDTIYWYDNELWIAITSTTEDPSIGMKWTVITNTNLYELDVRDINQKMDGYFVLISATVGGNFKVTKTADHQFTVDWISEGVATEAKIYDYKMTLLDTQDLIDNHLSYKFETDGLYIVSFLVDDVEYYTDIYDFTDSEKCFLRLMVDVLCECISCDDCPGENYNRALNYSSLYILIRDIVYSKKASDMGLTDETILNEEYNLALGLVMQKLHIMQSDCLCNNPKE